VIFCKKTRKLLNNQRLSSKPVCRSAAALPVFPVQRGGVTPSAAAAEAKVVFS
jgi:hypothetical protein